MTLKIIKRTVKITKQYVYEKRAVVYLQRMNSL